MLRAITRAAEAFGDFFLLYLKRIAETCGATGRNDVFGVARCKTATAYALNRRVTPDEKPWSAPEISRERGGEKTPDPFILPVYLTQPRAIARDKVRIHGHPRKIK